VIDKLTTKYSKITKKKNKDRKNLFVSFKPFVVNKLFFECASL